jgi:glycosyltransferase involved in cell wall biosynthesis
MRVIVIADFAVPSGGSQRVAVESARALAEAGAQVTFIHAIAGADAALDHPAIERICLDLTDVWFRNPASAAINGVWNREAANAMADALKPYVGARETVIHLHQWTRAFSPSILPALRATGLPVVTTAHDYFLACPNGVLFRFDRKEPCALKPMSAACIATNCDTRSYPHKLIRVARQAAARRRWAGWTLDVVHISDSARDRLAPLLPANWRHHRIDNPIAVTRAPREDKGALVAARAAEQIGADMLFIGEGPARAEIQALLPRAEITGWVEAGQVEALLRTRARAVLAPSLWPETGPLTVLEAAAIGLPSIVSARCGASEQVDATTGRVAEPTVEAFAAAMAALADDGVARAMGAAAYERFDGLLSD